MMTTRRKTPSQKRKEAREARAADPYAYQRSQERKLRKKKREKASINTFVNRFVAPMYTEHDDNDIEEARARLYNYVDKHHDYLHRDRDILLLAIYKIVKYGSR